MNINFEQKDELNATISITVEKSDYAESVDKALKTYQRKAVIPGFRPGKTPMSIVQKMYGTGVLLEEVNKLASQGISKYLEENKIDVLGQPTLAENNEDYDWTTAQDFNFKFDIGVAPKFDLQISPSDKFKRYIVNVDDKMIDEEITRVRQRYGSTGESEVSGQNDIIYATATELNSDGTALEGGVSSEISVLISVIKEDQLKSTLMGLKIGDEVNTDIFKLFDGNETEISTVLKINKETVHDLNKDFKLKIDGIKSFAPAELNQELFDKIYGAGSVTNEDEFRNKIKEELENFYKGESEHKLEHEMFDELAAKHNIKLPDTFLKKWLMDRHPDKFNPENVDKNYIPEANYLKNSLFQDKIIAANNIEINEEDLKAASLDYTKRMFFGYNLNVPAGDYLDKISEENLKDNNYRSKILNAAIVKRVNEALKSMVTVEEVQISSEEFFKMMEEHRAMHHHNHDHDHGDEVHEHEHEHA